MFFNISKNLLVTAFFGQTIGWYESLKKAYRIAQNSVRKAIEKTGKWEFCISWLVRPLRWFAIAIMAGKRNYRYQLDSPQCLALYTFALLPLLFLRPLSHRIPHSPKSRLLHFHLVTLANRVSLRFIRSAAYVWQNVFNFAFYERGRYTLIPRTNFCDNFIIFVILLRIRVFSGRCNKRYKYQIIECYACVTLYYTPDFFHRAKNENGCYQFKK